MNAIEKSVEPGAKIEYKVAGSRGRPTVAFVISKTARSLTVERTTNHEVVKIKPSDVVRLAATGRRMKPTKEAVRRVKVAPKPEPEVIAAPKVRRPRKQADAIKATVKELTGTGRRGRPRAEAPKAKVAPAKEPVQQPKRRGRPRKDQA